MNDEHVKNVVDVAAGGVTIAAFAGWITPVAAAVTLIYTLIRIWESPTGRRLLRAVCAKCADWWER